MRVVLIDDEPFNLDSLRIELNTYCPDVEIVGQFTDPREGALALRHAPPDLLFLDIAMPHMNGFQLLESLEDIAFDVVFVTAYDEYAVRAFNFNAVDYLVKPVQHADLVQAVQRARDRQGMRTVSGEELRALITNTQAHAGGLESIALPTAEGFEFIHVNTILYLQSDSNYTWVVLTDGTRHLLARTLKDMSGMIRYPQFFRAHQSYYVNLNHARKYVRGQGGYLVLQDGTQIPVSRANRDNLLLKFNL